MPATHSSKDTGDLLRKLRLARGWTQTDLAERLDTTAQTINRYENGKRKISVDTLYALADALDVPACKLLAEGDGLTSDEAALISRLRSNPHDKAILHSVLRGLREAEATDFTDEPQARVNRAS